MQPIMPLRLFASRQRTGAYLARMLFLGGMVSFFISPPSSCNVCGRIRPSGPGSALLADVIDDLRRRNAGAQIHAASG